MPEPLLSVILPSYNQSGLLERAIEALLEQERAADEIIIVDDGSTDDSLTVLVRYQVTEPAIRVLFNERREGRLASLQRGLKAARGRFVYLAATQEEVLPGFFADAIGMFERFPHSDLFTAETTLVSPASGRTVGFSPRVRPSRNTGFISPQDVAALLRRSDDVIDICSTVFRRKALLAQGSLMPEAGAFAVDLAARKIALAGGLCFLARPVATRRADADRLAEQNARDRDGVGESLRDLPLLVAADPGFPEWYPEVFRRRLRFDAARRALSLRSPDRRLLLEATAGTPLDRLVHNTLSPFLGFAVARAVLRCWLGLRLRPFRIKDWLVTAFDRRFGRPEKPPA